MQHTFPMKQLEQLVASQATMNAAHFLALPVLALHLTAVPRIGPGAAGVAIRLFFAIARIGPLVTGPLADRMGPWQAFRAGLALRTLGFAVLPFVECVDGAYLASLVLGIGVALHEPAVYGALGLAPEDKRDRLLMRHVQALNFGCVLGPCLALFAGWSTTTSFLMAAVATGLLTVWACMQRMHRAPRSRSQVNGRKKAIDWRYLAFAAALVPFWALFAQLFSALPMLLANAALLALPGSGTGSPRRCKIRS